MPVIMNLATPLAGAYLGKYQQGQEIPLSVQTFSFLGQPADPDDVPWVKVYRDGETPTLVESLPLAADLRGVAVGVFRRSLFLGGRYSTAGRYLALFVWAMDGAAMMLPAAFTLLPGGNADGAVIAMKYVERPDSRFLIWQTDGGHMVRGRNPR